LIRMRGFEIRPSGCFCHQLRAFILIRLYGSPSRKREPRIEVHSLVVLPVSLLRGVQWGTYLQQSLLLTYHPDSHQPA